MRRYNQDVIDGAKQLEKLIGPLDQNVANCKDETKEQVKAMQTTLSQHSYTDENIIANLSAKQKHIEIMMAKMKMQYVVHDYIEYGFSFGDIYSTLVGL